MGKLWTPTQVRVEVARREGAALRTSVAAAAAFGFDEPDRFLPRAELDRLGAQSDLTTLRPARGRGEVAVLGSCYAPGGEHVRAATVRLALGQVDKSLYVSGDRFWRGSDPLEAQPFRVMPLDLAHAFGGMGFWPNPAGKGVAPISLDGQTLYPLPNVYLPSRLNGLVRDDTETLVLGSRGPGGGVD
ncbi:MAG: DUF2169 domain-containing protein, partial [Myxococcota bacterium]